MSNTVKQKNSKEPRSYFYNMPDQKFKDGFRFNRNYILASFSDDLRPSGKESATMQELARDFQSFDGENKSNQVLSDDLVEIYRRQKEGENALTCDNIRFVTPDNDEGLLGVHHWANVESEKMTIYIYNPHRFYENMFSRVDNKTPKNKLLYFIE